MKLPRKIYDALNSQNGFDKLYIENHLKHKSHPKAYQAAVSQIKSYFKQYKPKHKQDSFKVRFWRKDDKVVDIPDQIFRVFYDFENLYMEYVRKYKLYKTAFDMLFRDVWKYFPDYKPYKNYMSFKETRNWALRNGKRQNG